MLKRTPLYAALASAGLLAATVGQSLAFDCTVANKPPSAGSVGTVDVTTGQFTPTKPNPGTEQQPHGGFVELQGPGVDTSTFLHAPTNAQAPQAVPGVNPGATKQEQQGRGCDGKGLDTLDACGFGG